MKQSLPISCMSVVLAGSAVLAGCGSGTATHSGTLGAGGSSPSGGTVAIGGSGAAVPALWATTPSASTKVSLFNAVALDTSNNVYAVGVMSSTTTFGANAVASLPTGVQSSAVPVLVKYDPSGEAQWARTVAADPADMNAAFWGVAVDPSGNVYVVGEISGGTNVSFTFGATTVQNSVAVGDAGIILRYDASGNVQWAKIIDGGEDSHFYAVTLDNAGNVYAVGSIMGVSEYSLGGGITATGSAVQDNALIAQYSPDGSASWAYAVTGTSATNYLSSSALNAVAVSADGSEVFVGGVITDVDTYDFHGVSITGSRTGSPHAAVLVQFNSAGTSTASAKIASATNESWGSSVAVDPDGNVYVTAKGDISGTDTVSYDFGNGVTWQAVKSQGATLVKYNASLLAQWAQTVTGISAVNFGSIVVDADKNAWIAGNLVRGSEVANFGQGITLAAGPSSANALLATYDPTGKPLAAQSVSAATGDSSFGGETGITNAFNSRSIAIGTDGHVVCVGYIKGTGTTTFSAGVSATGAYTGSNAVAVKY